MSSSRSPRGPRRSWAARGVTAVVAITLALLLSGCSEESVDQWKRLGLPDPASDRAIYVRDLWVGSWIAAGIIGVFVWGLIIWAAVRYRRRGDDAAPSQVRYNLPIEVLYTVAPIIVIAVLFYFTVETQNRELEDVETEHTVNVTAQQWSWTFSYLDEDATGGEDVYDQGTPATLPELWLVEDEPVLFQLYSPDVIHSFWIPSFYFKLDIIPGPSQDSSQNRDSGGRQSFTMTPTEKGRFAGRCAEFCGYLHSRMLFTVVVASQEEYDAHLRELQAAGQVGVPLGPRDSEDVAGLDSEGGE